MHHFKSRARRLAVAIAAALSVISLIVVSTGIGGDAPRAEKDRASDQGRSDQGKTVDSANPPSTPNPETFKPAAKTPSAAADRPPAVNVKSTDKPWVTDRPRVTLADLLSELSDQQLASLARGEPVPQVLAELRDPNDDSLEVLLLRELARRLDGSQGNGSQEKRPHGKTTQGKAPQGRPAADPAEIASGENPGGSVLPTTDEAQPLAEPAAVTIELENVTAEAAAGEPAGVGRIELRFAAGHGPTIYPDQPLFLTSDEDRVRYASFEIDYQIWNEQDPWQVSSLEVAFLIHGDEPLSVRIATLEQVVLSKQVVKLNAPPHRHQTLKTAWWKSFSEVSPELESDQKRLKQSFLDLLARRHRLPSPWPAVDRRDSKKSMDLESHFERAVGMLSGIESVKLAMQDDVTLKQSARFEKADQSIPGRPTMRSVAVPKFREVAIESIARHVPEECFYLRTESVAHYRYFREFLTGWGGSLQDIVANGALDRNLREKIEFQLGLDSKEVTAERVDGLISDMAMIGCDPLFHDGAAVGILFQATDSQALANELKRHRARVRATIPAVGEQRLEVDRHIVSFLACDDNRVRSFYAIDGPYHLITNSEYLIHRFFEAGKGVRSLGGLNEFRYARSKSSHIAQPLAFLYLSDPFFQNLVSPRYRIEMTRRARAKQELQQLQLAHHVARAEGIDATSVQELIEARLLPVGFAKRADGSRPVVKDGRYQDSLRGVRGAFLPVPDVACDKATRSEVNAYGLFVSNYNRQWGRIDPVTVVFSRRGKAIDEELHHVKLEIIVTPYARRRYALLTRHLAEPSRQQLSAAEGDLISFQAAVRMGPSSAAHLLSMGLRDDEVPFVIKGGEIRLSEEESGTSFAKKHSYAAMTPPSTDVLRMLVSVLIKGEPIAQTASGPQPPRPVSKPRVPMPLPPSVPHAGQALYYFAWGITNWSPRVIEASILESLVETRGDLTVASTNKDLRRQTFESIDTYFEGDPHKVRMRVGALRNAKVEPYIQAYTYLQARRASGENARLLNGFTNGLHLPPERARGALENLLGAEIRCPLGGEFKLQTVDGRSAWSASSWNGMSLVEISETPESWRFPFLDWLHRLDVKFDIDESTLRAEIEMTVRYSDAPDKAITGELAGF